MPGASAEKRSLFLSTVPAGPGERRVALAFVLASTAVFVVAAPFARTPLPVAPAFVAIYESALVVNDLITAVFLFSQFTTLRSRPLLLLASGYLFTALVAVAHALTFPGLFSPTGMLGAGPQSTAWLYLFWHAGFPLLVIAYARFKDQGYLRKPSSRSDHGVVLLGVAASFFAALGLTLVATAGHDMLPAIMRGNHYTPAMSIIVSGVWLLSFAALIVVWRRQPHSVLDVWLMVVLCAWVLDIALSAIFSAGRYDLGWYAGRIYGLVATSFVLIMLLMADSRLYSGLVDAHESDREKFAELHHLATVDALTGIANRRAFEKAIDEECRRTMRHKTPLCLLMIDVDFFKRYNDAYGHVAGDQCLRSIGKVLAGNARRAGEVAARYGGEEFAVLLPNSDVGDALEVARRICSDVRELNIPHKASTAAAHVTISVGVACAVRALDLQALSDHDAQAKSPSAPTILVEMADRALYVAKGAGRDRAFSAGLDDVVPAEQPAA